MSELLHRIWVVIKDIARILHQSRFSLIIVLFTIISLEYVGQIKDIVLGLSHPESLYQVVFFILAVNWLAFQSWGWARFIYDKTCLNQAGERGELGYQRILIDWLPRIYAMAAFWAAYRAATRANVDYVAYGIILVAVIVLAFLIFRRDINRKFSIVEKLCSEKNTFYFTFTIMLVTTVYAIWSPVGFGSLLGAGAVVFLGLGSIIPVGTLLVNAAREAGFPVVGGLLLLAVIFSPFNDNHHVREIENESSQTNKKTLQQSIDAWLSQRDPGKPMVLVATAGGGLRASYWTGVIMGRLQDQIPSFNKQVLAISGVSGGSVGAVFYNGALANDSDCSSGSKDQSCFESKLLDSIGKDYLAATAASMLYGDLIQRFLPVAIFSDRAAALEESWEAGFQSVYPDAQCGLDISFTQFFDESQCGKEWLPRLLINGTYEETGRRLLTTSFKVEPSIFLDTHDFYQLNDQAAIRASTAALNSARFSYVSPAGTFGDDVGHVIDGGYFENYGANTLTNLIDRLKRDPGNPLSGGLIVIAISNDSNIPLEQYDISATPATANAQNLMNEVLAPILGLANTRSGHGMLAYKQLAQYTKQIDSDGSVDMVHFYLAPKLGQPPPLGWILSEQAKENMKKQITEEHNKGGYSLILERFGG